MYPCVHVTKARTSSVLYRDSLVAKKIYKIDLVFIIKSFTEASPPPPVVRLMVITSCMLTLKSQKQTP